MIAIKPTIHEVKPTVPWHQRYVSGSYRSSHKSTGFPQITYGQALSGAAIGISIIDLIANVFSKGNDGSSFVRKFVAPAFCTTLGFIGFSASKPPSNVFENELVNNGILNIVDKLLKDISSAHSFSRVFNGDFTENLTRAVNSLLTNVSRKISALASEHSNGNEALNGISLITRNPDDFTLDKLSKFISNLTPEKFYLLLREKENFVKGVLRTAFKNENSGVRPSIRGLVKVINNGLLMPHGLEMDIGYDDRNNLLRVNLYTTDIFTDGAKHYKPCISVLCKPEDFYLGLHNLNKSLACVKNGSGEKAQDFNRQILSAFLSGFEGFLKSGRVEGGYCDVTITTGGVMSGVVRSKHIESIITTPVKNAINSLLQNITLPGSVRPAKSQGEVLIGEAGEPPFEDVTNDETLSEVQNLNGLLKRLGFKNIKWDENDVESRNIARLKMAYIIAYFRHRTFIDEAPIPKQVSNQVCNDLRRFLGNEAVEKEYIPLFSKVNENTFPDLFLDLDLILQALEVESDSPITDVEKRKLDNLIKYLPNERYREDIRETLVNRQSEAIVSY